MGFYEETRSALGFYVPSADASMEKNQEVEEIVNSYENVEFDVEEMHQVRNQAPTDEEFDKFLEEVDKKAEFLNVLVDAEDAKTTSQSIEIDTVTGATGTQTVSMDLSALGSAWEGDGNVPLIDRHISFNYDYEDDPASPALPTFTNAYNASSYISGVEWLDWNQEAVGAAINSAGSEVELTASGTWGVSAEAYGLSLGLSAQDDWAFGYSAQNI